MGDLDVVIGKRGVSGALGVPGAVAPHWSRDGTTKPIDEFVEAKARGIRTRPVLVGPVSFLLLARTPDGRGAPIGARLEVTGEEVEELQPILVWPRQDRRAGNGAPAHRVHDLALFPNHRHGARSALGNSTHLPPGIIIATLHLPRFPVSKIGGDETCFPPAVQRVLHHR